MVSELRILSNTPCYVSGRSIHLGPVVLKCQPSGYDSTEKEKSLLEQGFAHVCRQRVPLSKMFFSDVCAIRAPTLSVLESLSTVFSLGIELLLDVAEALIGFRCRSGR